LTRLDSRTQACFQLLAGADIVGNQQIDPWQSGPNMGSAEPIIPNDSRLILGTTIMVVLTGPSSRSNRWPREVAASRCRTFIGNRRGHQDRFQDDKAARARICDYITRRKVA
jgi:hypothetical protein